MPSKPDSNRETASLIGLAVGLLVLLQAPMVEIRDLGKEPRLRRRLFSPLEITAMTAHDKYPIIAPGVQALLIPGAWIKEVLKVATSCQLYFSGRESAASNCKPEYLTNWTRLAEISDMSVLAQPLKRVMKEEGHSLLGATSAVVSLSGLGCFIRPSNMFGLGIILLAGVTHLAPACSIAYNMWLCIMLGVLMVAFLGFSDYTDHKAKKAAVAARKGKTTSAANPLTAASPKAKSSTTTGSVRKKKGGKL